MIVNCAREIGDVRKRRVLKTRRFRGGLLLSTTYYCPLPITQPSSSLYKRLDSVSALPTLALFGTILVVSLIPTRRNIDLPKDSQRFPSELAPGNPKIRRASRAETAFP